MLVARRQAIVRLLDSTSAVAKQLTGLVHDNEAKLAPSLAKINSVTGGAGKEPRQPRQSVAGAGEVSS